MLIYILSADGSYILFDILDDLDGLKKPYNLELFNSLKVFDSFEVFNGLKEFNNLKLFKILKALIVLNNQEILDGIKIPTVLG